MISLLEQARKKAEEVLSTECSPLGLMASPDGYPHQAWSAGMFLFAYHCLEQESVSLLAHTVALV